MARREYRTISKRARTLLNRAEGFDVDFKQSAAGLSSDDLVAFANAGAGGAILLGVEETVDASGRQRGRVVGCPVGDAARGSIMNRAESCVPPVTIELFAENLAATPFFRIEIPSGPHKPYCTAGGTYKIRGDGQNRPLRPGQLLALFMETESSEFLNRFRAATHELERELGNTKSSVLDQVQELLQGLAALQQTLGQTHEVAAEAHAFADDAMITAGNTLAVALDMRDELNRLQGVRLPQLERKLDALLRHLELEVPSPPSADGRSPGQD